MRALRILALLLMLSLVCGPAGATQADDEAAFTARFAERLRAALPDQPYAIAGPLQLRGPQNAEINIGRIFNFCSASTPDECETAIDTFVNAMREALARADSPATREQLRLAVRNQEFCDYVAQIPRENAANANSLATRGIGSGLCAILMIDFPRSMRSASGDDLATLRLDSDAAWALAEQQTLAALPGEGAFAGLETGMIMVTQYDYIPSLMLARDLWRDLTSRHGPLIVMIPEDGLLVAVRRTAATDIRGLRATTREAFDTGERGISPLLYTWTADGWQSID